MSTPGRALFTTGQEVIRLMPSNAFAQRQSAQICSAFRGSQVETRTAFVMAGHVHAGKAQQLRECSFDYDL